MKKQGDLKSKRSRGFWKAKEAGGPEKQKKQGDLKSKRSRWTNCLMQRVSNLANYNIVMFRTEQPTKGPLPEAQPCTQPHLIL
jgi:hypothetical protein